MNKFDMTRRQFLGTSAASTIVFTGGMEARATGGITIGMIYVGPRDDYGWNQAHAGGAKALKAIPGVTLVEEENVPETNAITQTMESMIKVDGAKILFPNPFGYFEPVMNKPAKKFL